MADGDDPFVSIIDDCLYSSSQEELLESTNFPREDEAFSADDSKPPGMVDSGRHRTEFDGEGVDGGSNQVKFGVSADDENEVLEFLKEWNKSTIEESEEGSSPEPPLKKSRVSGSKLKSENFSPLVQCSEKIVIDSEDDEKIEPKKNQDDHGKGDENQKDGSSGTRSKRVLPQSLLGQVWGMNADGIDEIRNRRVETHNNEEQCEESAEENGGQKSTTNDENSRNLMGILKMIATTQMASDADDDEKIDIFETAKRRGMTFPRSRFLVDKDVDK